jgi:hypothetical protein
LLKGIFVILLSFAVALTSSTTVLNKSLFSRGNFAIKERKAEIRLCEAGRIPLKDGMANVDREGGLRKFGAGNAEVVEEEIGEGIEEPCEEEGF